MHLPSDPAALAARFDFKQALPAEEAARVVAWLVDVRWAMLALAAVAVPVVAAALARAARDAPAAGRRAGVALGALCLGIFAARLWLLPHQALVVIDEWQNLGAIRELATTGLYAYRSVDIAGLPVRWEVLEYAPLFHVLASLLVEAGLEARAAAAGLNAALLTSLTPLFYLLVRALRPEWGAGVAGAAGVLYGLLPIHVALSRTATTDPLLSVLLLAGAILVAHAARRPERARLDLAGLVAVAALACYARQEAVFLLAAFGAAAWLAARVVAGECRPLGARLRLGPAGTAAACLLAGAGLAATLAPGVAHTWVTNIVGKGSVTPLERVVEGLPPTLLNLATVALTPAAMPVWLTWLVVRASRAAAPSRASDRAWAAALAVAWVAVCFVYTQSQDAWTADKTVLDATFFTKEYHLGPLYLVASVAVLRFLPDPAGLAAGRPWRVFAVALALDVGGAAVQYATYLWGWSEDEDGVLEAAAGHLEPDAILLGAVPVQLRFAGGRDAGPTHLLLDAAHPQVAAALTHRPVYVLLGRRAPRQVQATVDAAAWHLTPSPHPLLPRAHPPLPLPTPGPTPATP